LALPRRRRVVFFVAVAAYRVEAAFFVDAVPARPAEATVLFVAVPAYRVEAAFFVDAVPARCVVFFVMARCVVFFDAAARPDEATFLAFFSGM
jgi:hypothetical protein